MKAVQKEAKSFEQWRCLRPIPPEEEQEIMSNPELKKRVINSRGCYRDKNKGVPPLNAKARIVAQGNQDPDLRSLTRQSPTPNRVSEFLVMAIFVSGINQMAFDSALRWKLWIADAATAFLQGAQDMTERAGNFIFEHHEMKSSSVPMCSSPCSTRSLGTSMGCQMLQLLGQGKWLQDCVS